MSIVRANRFESIDTTDGGINIDSSGHVQVDGVQMPTTGPLSNRNLIINGAMNVAQRDTQVTSVTTGGYRTCDRFHLNVTTLGTWTVDQSTDAPDGFSNSFKATCTTADASPAAGDAVLLSQRIEAQNLQHLKFGTSAAESLTLSFYVKSNKTGAASVDMYQPDASNRQISKSYTINSANTWEYKTITFPSDTSGVINNDNGIGLFVEWWLNSGSDYNSGSLQTTWGALDQTSRNASNLGVGGAVSDYFSITGIQLEVGTVATPFENRSYGDELARCQRYFHKSFQQDTAPAQNVGNSIGAASFISCYVGLHQITYFYPVPLRTIPSTVTTYSPNAASSNWSTNGDSPSASINNSGEGRCSIRASTPGIAGRVYYIHLTADAEL